MHYLLALFTEIAGVTGGFSFCGYEMGKWWQQENKLLYEHPPSLPNQHGQYLLLLNKNFWLYVERELAA